MSTANKNNVGAATQLTLGQVLELLHQYDSLHGRYPEHASEGLSVGVFILRQLGVAVELAEKLLGPVDEHSVSDVREALEAAKDSRMYGYYERAGATDFI